MSSVPLRVALDPVTRYNERLNRARQNNSSQSNLKLKELSSPAPPSFAKCSFSVQGAYSGGGMNALVGTAT